MRPQDVLTLLENAVQTAGFAVYQKGQVEPEKRGMGTTTSALLISGDRGFIAHVGDSRIYMLRAGQVVQLTEDHSLVNELIRRGRVTKESFETSPYKAYKNAVTRAVGVYETVQGDTIDFEILPGDQFLLCSDGLHAYLNDARIIDMLKGDDVKALPKKLVDMANAGGGHDNITAVVVRVEQPTVAAGTIPPTDDRAEELARKVDVLRRMPLFRHLVYKEILRLLNVTSVKEYAPGEEIIKEGTPGDEMFVLLRGKIRLHKNDAFITHLEPGAHIGEMALVDRRHPRSASATAEERTRVLDPVAQRFLRNHSQGTAAVDKATVGVHAGAGRPAAQDDRGAVGRPPGGPRGRSDRRRAVRRREPVGNETMSRPETECRTESDSLGKVEVPAHALYGAQTQRAVENFPVSGLRLPRRVIRALALIKKAAAEVNRASDKLDRQRSPTPSSPPRTRSPPASTTTRSSSTSSRPGRAPPAT